MSGLMKHCSTLRHVRDDVMKQFMFFMNELFARFQDEGLRKTAIAALELMNLNSGDNNHT